MPQDLSHNVPVDGSMRVEHFDVYIGTFDPGAGPYRQALIIQLGTERYDVTSWVARIREEATRWPYVAGTAALPNVLDEVKAEYKKQVAKWGDDHDDEEHGTGELADVAAYLAHPDPRPTFDFQRGVRLTPEWARPLRFKHTRREQLVIAAALCLREADRLEREEDRCRKS